MATLAVILFKKFTHVTHDPTFFTVSALATDALKNVFEIPLSAHKMSLAINLWERLGSPLRKHELVKFNHVHVLGACLTIKGGVYYYRTAACNTFVVMPFVVTWCNHTGVPSVATWMPRLKSVLMWLERADILRADAFNCWSECFVCKVTGCIRFKVANFTTGPCLHPTTTEGRL